MKPAMYIFVNEGLGMSPGKMAAQASHAAIEAYRATNSTMVEEWYKAGHYTKLIMQARDTEHLISIERYLRERGISSRLIIDEGHTEIPPITPTALGVVVVDRDDPEISAIFSSFQTLKPPRPTAKHASVWERLRPSKG